MMKLYTKIDNIYMPFYCYFVISALVSSILVNYSDITPLVAGLITGLVHSLFAAILFPFLRLTKWKEKFQYPENNNSDNDNITNE